MEDWSGFKTLRKVNSESKNQMNANWDFPLYENMTPNPSNWKLLDFHHVRREF